VLVTADKDSRIFPARTGERYSLYPGSAAEASLELVNGNSGVADELRRVAETITHSAVARDYARRPALLAKMESGAERVS